MILFFGDPKLKVFAVQITKELSSEDIKKLSWVLNSVYLESTEISEKFIGPKSLMISPWSTNAVEITKNMGLKKKSLYVLNTVNNFVPILKEIKNNPQLIFRKDHKLSFRAKFI